jgi:indolepyruvate decarboxylase
MTVKHLVTRINELLTDDVIVIADAGDALFAAADLVMHRDVGFLGQAFYLSIGFSLPATLGAQLAAPSRRIMTLIGDGALQMTVQEFSTIARHKLNPIVIVLNNGGYTAERLIHEGPYNDIQGWQNHRLPELFGGGWGVRVTTEGEFEAAFKKALAFTGGPSLLEVMLDPSDSSEQLKRLCAELAPKG